MTNEELVRRTGNTREFAFSRQYPGNAPALLLDMIVKRIFSDSDCTVEIDTITDYARYLDKALSLVNQGAGVQEVK